MTKRLAIDIRCLLHPHQTGVALYTRNLLTYLPQYLPDWEIIYFSSSYNKDLCENIPQEIFAENTRHIHFKVPNKLFHLALKLKLISLDTLLEEKYKLPCDAFFFPNMHFLHLKHTPYILTIHDLSPLLFPDFYSLKRRLWHRLVGLTGLISHAKHVLSVSHSTSHALQAHLAVPAHELTTTPLAIDTPQKIQHYPKLLDEPYILYTGTLEPRKNILSLITAFEHMPEGYKLVLAGSMGWKAHKLKKLIDKSPKQKDIILTGYISEADKIAYYQHAAAFIFVAHHEGFGLPPFESILYAPNVPVIISSGTPMATYIDTPYIVHASRPEILAHTIQQAITQQKTAQITLDSSWQKVAQDTAQAILKIL